MGLISHGYRTRRGHNGSPFSPFKKPMILNRLSAGIIRPAAILVAALFFTGCRTANDQYAYLSFVPTALHHDQSSLEGIEESGLDVIVLDVSPAGKARVVLGYLDKTESTFFPSIFVGGFQGPEACARIVLGFSCPEPSFTPVMFRAPAFATDGESGDATTLEFAWKVKRELEKFSAKIAWLESPQDFQWPSFPLFH